MNKFKKIVFLGFMACFALSFLTANNASAISPLQPLNYDEIRSSGGDLQSISRGIYANIAIIAGIIFDLTAIAGLVGIVYGGLLYATAGLSPDKAAKGKKSIMNSIIGTIIGVGGTTILSAIYGLIAKQEPADIIVSVSKELALWVGIVSVTMIVYGALQYTMAGMNPAQAAKGKQTIIYACIGIVIATAAYVILNFAISVAPGGGSTGGGAVIVSLKNAFDLLGVGK